MSKVSVVIPLYNKGAYVERAVRSALAQTFADFEIIVIDDGSTDDGAIVVSKISDSRIRLIRQENQGISEARNRGISEARSELIAFLDADDAWKPHFLSTILRLKARCPDVGIYCTKYEYVELSGKTWIPSFKGIPPAPWEGIIPDYFYAALGNIPPVWTSATAIPKAVFDAVGMFTPGEKVGEDIDMWLRIALQYKVAFSNEVSATYFRDTINGACRSGIVWPDRALKRTALKVLQEGILTVKQLEYLREYMYKNDLEVVKMMLWSGQRKEAWTFLKDNHTQYFRVRKLWLWFCSFLPCLLVRLMYRVKYVLYGLE